MANMGMKFKIIYGFDSEQEISIDPDELEKAYGLFLLGGRAVFKSGDAVDARFIQAIREDYHATMGWAKTHTLETEDYNELHDRGVTGKMKMLMASVKERVDYLIANGQQAQIGKNIEIPELARPVERREGKVKSIGEML